MPPKTVVFHSPKLLMVVCALALLTIVSQTCFFQLNVGFTFSHHSMILIRLFVSLHLLSVPLEKKQKNTIPDTVSSSCLGFLRKKGPEGAFGLGYKSSLLQRTYAVSRHLATSLTFKWFSGKSYLVSFPSKTKSKLFGFVIFSGNTNQKKTLRK